MYDLESSYIVWKICHLLAIMMYLLCFPLLMSQSEFSTTTNHPIINLRIINCLIKSLVMNNGRWLIYMTQINIYKSVISCLSREVKIKIAPCEYINNVSSYRSTFHACRLVWPPWTSFPLLTHRVNVQYVVYVDPSPYPAFHITELWAWISLLVDCNFVIWVLVIAGIDFIRNFKGKKLESEPAGGLKPSTAVTLALKQIPSHSNTAYPSPVSIPSFLHPPLIFFCLCTLIWWYHRLV